MSVYDKLVSLFGFYTGYRLSPRRIVLDAVFTVRQVTIQISLPINKNIEINWGNNTRQTVNGTGSLQSITSNYTISKQYRISLRGNLGAMTLFKCNNNFISGNTIDFAYLPSLSYLDIAGTIISGDIGYILSNPNLNRLIISNTRITGNISRRLLSIINFEAANCDISGYLSNLNSGRLQNIDITNTSIGGNIRDIADNYFYYIKASGSKIYGDIATLSGYSHLYTFKASDTSIHGNLFTFVSNNPYLNILEVANTNVDGDFSAYALNSFWLSYCISGSKVNMYTDSVITYSSFIPIISACELFFITDAMMDQFIIDLDDSGITGGYLYITGSPRTMASNSAIASLQSKGWTIIE